MAHAQGGKLSQSVAQANTDTFMDQDKLTELQSGHGGKGGKPAEASAESAIDMSRPLDTQDAMAQKALKGQKADQTRPDSQAHA